MNAKLKEKREPKEREYDLDDKEDKAMYDDALNEQGDIVIGILHYSPAMVLEEVDPTAYRCGFNDYTDGLDRRFICPICDEEHADEDSARDCCQEDTWTCSACNAEYDSEDEAEECCKPEEKENE